MKNFLFNERVPIRSAHAHSARSLNGSDRVAIYMSGEVANVDVFIFAMDLN